MRKGKVTMTCSCSGLPVEHSSGEEYTSTDKRNENNSHRIIFCDLTVRFGDSGIDCLVSWQHYINMQQGTSINLTLPLLCVYSHPDNMVLWDHTWWTYTRWCRTINITLPRLHVYSHPDNMVLWHHWSHLINMHQVISLCPDCMRKLLVCLISHPWR